MPFVVAAESSLLDGSEQVIILNKYEIQPFMNFPEPRDTVLVRSKSTASILPSTQPVQSPPVASPVPSSWVPTQMLSIERKFEIDAYADTTPAHVSQSIAALAAYLSGVGSDELSRARVLYRWVTRNIRYDVDGFLRGKRGRQDAQFVLENRMAVCQGYAQLAESLGSAMGLNIHVVTGWAKGYSYTPGMKFSGRSTHAWNAVQIDGTWRLMDPTWGAGHIDKNNNFVRSFEDHYFFTPPNVFVVSHLPEDAIWQLLPNPIGAEDFAELAFTKPAFWRLGFRLGEHKRVHITTADRVKVNFLLTQNVSMHAQLIAANPNNVLGNEHTLIHVNSNQAMVDVVFPRSGEYILRIFAKEKYRSGPLDWIMDYRITAQSGSEASKFPLAYGDFTSRQVILTEPRTGVLKNGRRYRFHLRVPDAVNVSVVTDGIWQDLLKNEDEWLGDVIAKSGEPTVFAKFKSNRDFTALLKYTSE